MMNPSSRSKVRSGLVIGTFLLLSSARGDDVALLFPANPYTGDSQLDPRRPSVIIDHAETSSIDGYIEKIDRLGGKDGLMILYEIRMLRPGFYLGRVYFGTLFDADAERSGSQVI